MHWRHAAGFAVWTLLVAASSILVYDRYFNRSKHEPAKFRQTYLNPKLESAIRLACPHLERLAFGDPDSILAKSYRLGGLDCDGRYLVFSYIGHETESKYGADRDWSDEYSIFEKRGEMWHELIPGVISSGHGSWNVDMAVGYLRAEGLISPQAEEPSKDR